MSGGVRKQRLEDAAAAANPGRARRHHEEEHVNHEAWAIPYGDLITLLLAFFVVMYSISSVNEGKYRALSDSLMRAFKSPATSMKPVQIGKVSRRGSQRDNALQVSRPAEIMQVGGPHVSVDERESTLAMPQVARATDAELDKAASAAQKRQLDGIADEIRASMQSLIDRKDVVVRELPAGLEVEIKTDILFPSGVARLAPAARPALKRLAETLAKFPNPLQVEGHTDNRPINTARYPSNWVLSAARAATVVHLFSQQGIAPGRMSVHGHGEQRPIADNDTAAGRNANRRVVVVIRTLPDIQGLPASVAGTPSQSAEG